MDNFLLELEVGSWPLAGVLFALFFGRAHKLGLPQAPAVAVVRLVHDMSVEPFDSATALSKEACDENLWKLKPTPSRRKLRVFVRTGSHTSFVHHST